MTDRDEFVSASELARMGYCERQVAFDACHGQRVTVQQEQARDRGLKAHADFLEDSRRIAAASATKGRCFIATLVLGECDDTRGLRAFWDTNNLGGPVGPRRAVAALAPTVPCSR